MNACLSHSWVPVCSGHFVPRDTGVFRGEAIREASVPEPGRPVPDGLQVLPLWPTCVGDGCSYSKVTLLVKNLPYILFFTI